MPQGRLRQVILGMGIGFPPAALVDGWYCGRSSTPHRAFGGNAYRQGYCPTRQKFSPCDALLQEFSAFEVVADVSLTKRLIRFFP
jgi:hypothetical protein